MGKRANGEGTISYHKARNCYKGRLSLGFDENGKALRKYFYGKTKKEVKEKMDEYRMLNPTGNPDQINNYTVSKWFRYWLFNIKKRDIKPKTFERYEGILRVYIDDSEIANIPLYKLHVEHLQLYYNRLLNIGKTPETIERINSKLKTCLIVAERMGYIEKNPCKLVSMPKLTHENKLEVFTQEQQEQFLKLLKGYDMEMFFLMAISTGMRLGELLGLKWADIDHEKRTVTVNRAIQKCYSFDNEGNKKLTVTESTPKTSNSYRTIPLFENIYNKLIEYKKGQDILKKSKIYKDQDFIFANEYGNPLDPKKPQQRFKKLQAEMGLEKDEYIKFHGLRKTYATRLFEKGIPPKTVQVLLGHSNIEITLNIYTQVMESEKSIAIEKAADLFSI